MYASYRLLFSNLLICAFLIKHVFLNKHSYVYLIHAIDYCRNIKKK